MSKPRYDRTVVLPPRLAQRLAAIAAAEHLTLRALVLLAARECARAYPDRFRAGKRLWGRADDRALRAHFPHEATAATAQRIRRSITATHHHAQLLGLKKTAAHRSALVAAARRRGYVNGAAFGFTKGNVPANKGVKRPPGWGPGRMKATQFKCGVPSWRTMPIGSTRVVDDGYVYRKVTETPNVPWKRNWTLDHVLVWSAANGPVPRSHAIVFRNGDKRDIRLDNLECITRRQLMARNTVHNLPKPLADTVQLLGKLNQVIRNRSRSEASA